MTIHWKYDVMYNWYRKLNDLGNPSKSNLIAIIYESKKTTKNKEHQLEPFIKPNIEGISHFPIHQKELYVVYDDDKNNKKHLYFVFPTWKLAERQKYLAADHFTFCHDKSDKKMSCHFHSTIYTYLQELKRYETAHLRDYMKMELTLPRDESSIFNNHENYKQLLLNVIKYPWTHDKPSQNINGGKPSLRRKQRPIMNPEFCDKWNEHGIKKVVLFGFIYDGQVHWNATIYEKGRLNEGLLYNALCYKTYIMINEIDYEMEFQNKFVDCF